MDSQLIADSIEGLLYIPAKLFRNRIVCGSVIPVVSRNEGATIKVEFGTDDLARLPNADFAI